MARQRLRRRLAAIMAADVVGYSRAMEADEEGTLARLGELRGEILDPAIAAHSGRIFKKTGDGLLAEFASSVDALRCAIGVQRSLKARTDGSPDVRRLQLRVGINLGDVIIEGKDVYGTGVNVAARLQELADSGGICISGRVAEDTERLVDAAFDYLGPQTVKNIERPVDVYAVRLDGQPGAGASVAGPAVGRSMRWSVLAAAGIAVAATLAGGGWWWTQHRAPAGMTGTETALPLPDRPSIAVLPFDDLGGDESQRYFADGMTEDLITDLSKVSGLFVIARNSAFAFRAADTPVGDIADALGVRYVLQGSVRRAGGQIRINAQLTDAQRGSTVWADRYDGARDDVFALQDAVTRQIVSVLEVRLTRTEEAELTRLDTTVPAAHDAFLRGWERYLEQTPQDMKAAIAGFEEAVALDPDYGRAHAAIAAAHWQIARRLWHAEFGYPNVHRARARAEALLARALRWETPLAHQLATSMLSQQGRHTEALAEGAKALGLDPNDADSFVALAGALSLAGDAEQALTLVHQAMRLNPRSPASYHYEMGLAEFGLGNFSRAADALMRAIALAPDDRWSERLLVATLGQLGRTREAQNIVEEDASWYGADPFTVRAVTYWYPYRDPADLARLQEGLRKAGLPD
jgi:adenylate cyclase